MPAAALESETTLQAEIVKVDEEKRLVFGFAYVSHDAGGQLQVDKSGDFVDDPEELEKTAYQFVLHSRDGGDFHQRKGVSTLVESVVFTPEKVEKMGLPPGVAPTAWWVGYRVHDDEVWANVRKGLYTSFSIHGKGVRKEVTKQDGGGPHAFRNENAKKPGKKTCDVCGRVASAHKVKRVRKLDKGFRHAELVNKGRGHAIDAATRAKISRALKGRKRGGSVATAQRRTAMAAESKYGGDWSGTSVAAKVKQHDTSVRGGKFNSGDRVEFPGTTPYGKSKQVRGKVVGHYSNGDLKVEQGGSRVRVKPSKAKITATATDAAKRRKSGAKAAARTRTIRSRRARSGADRNVPYYGANRGYGSLYD